MKVEPIRPERSRRRRTVDLAISLAMLAAIAALYVLVLCRGHLPL